MEAGNCIDTTTKGPTMKIPNKLPIVPIIQCNDSPYVDDTVPDVTVKQPDSGKTREKRDFYKHPSRSYGEVLSHAANLVGSCNSRNPPDKRNCDTNNNNSRNKDTGCGSFQKQQQQFLVVNDNTPVTSDDSDSEVEATFSRRNLLLLPKLSISRRRTFGQQSLRRSQGIMENDNQFRRHSWIW